MRYRTTRDIAQGSGASGPKRGPSVPGLVVIMDNDRPRSEAFALPKSGLVLGRDQPSGFFVEDETVSRSHLRVRRVAGCWSLEDAGSRNGSFVNGERLEKPCVVDE